MRPSVCSPRPPEADSAVSLQDLPPSVLLLIATALAPPLLKHTFRLPNVHRERHTTLLAASSTCRALRNACFPLIAQVMRSPGLRPQNIADLGESVRELEARVDYVLSEGTKHELREHVRKLDVEIHARAPRRLVSKLVDLVNSLPHLHFLALKLPAYRVFRDAFISDMREIVSGKFERLTELCIDARLSWFVEFVPNVRELVLWSWPSDVDRDGGLTAEETRDGWRTFLARLNAHAPNVRQVEVGGLSIYDVNELFASLTNYPLSNLHTLRILHRKEEHGAIPLPDECIPDDIAQDIEQIWEDTEQEEVISGLAGNVQRIVYFDLQEECGSVYVPDEGGRDDDEEEEQEGKEARLGSWVDNGPAVVLSCMKARCAM